MKNFFRLCKRMIKGLLPRKSEPYLRRFLAPRCQRGPNSHIARRVQLIGAANIRLGENTVIAEDSWLNVNHREPGKLAIVIGDNCFIGRRNFFSSGREIVFGDYVLTTNDCRFIGSSHVTDNPAVPYLTSGTTASDSIHVGHNCFFGSGATVMGNVTVGHGSVLGAGAFLTASIPAFSVAVGSPARVIKRYSFAKNAWIDCANLDDGDLAANPDANEYLAMLRSNCPDTAMPLVVASTAFGNR